MSPYVIPGLIIGSVVLKRPEPIDFYKKRVSEYYGIPISKIDSKTRKRVIVIARQIGIYLARKYSKCSLKTIAEAFGGRDHTTAIHSIKTVRDLMDTDEDYRERVLHLEAHLYEGSTVGEFIEN
jgi:chromosomal replication initiator protein